MHGRGSRYTPINISPQDAAAHGLSSRRKPTHASLTALFSCFSNVQSLSLDGGSSIMSRFPICSLTSCVVTMSTAEMRVLADVLRAPVCRLNTLTLSRADIQPNDLRLLVKPLQRNTTLSTLALSRFVLSSSQHSQIHSLSHTLGCL